MDKVLGEFMWAQKYRPQKIDDVILPQEVKKSVKENIANGSASNFLFDGPAGTGKTTLAYAIANELNAEVLRLNGSGSGRGIDTIRHDIPAFCTSMSIDHSRKIVLIDEGDHLTPDAQAALRATIEEYSKSTTFIITSNSKNRLSEPIRSRFVEIDFKTVDAHSKGMKTQLLKRIVSIIEEEYGEKPNKEHMAVIAQLIEIYFPNNRKILNTLQTMMNAGNLSASSLSLISVDRFVELSEFLKTGKWKKMREWVAENSDVNPENIVDFFWKHGEEFFGIQNMPLIILNVDDYQRHVNMVRNPVIATVALFTKIMQQVNK